MYIYMQVKQRVRLDELFPGEEETVEQLESNLRKLNKTDTLFWIARLNLILSNPDHHDPNDKQRYIARQFLDTEQLKTLDRFAGEVGLDSMTLIERSCLLELSSWVLQECPDNPDDLRTFCTRETSLLFIKSAITSGLLWSEYVYKNGISDHDHQFLPVLRANVKQHRSAMPLWRSVARGMILFSQCMGSYGASIKSEFKNITGLTIENYYLCALIIWSQYCFVKPSDVENNNQKCGGFNIATFMNKCTDEAKQVMNRFLDQESQTAQQMTQRFAEYEVSKDRSRSNVIERLCIDRPILRSGENTQMGIVFDLVAFSKKVSLAPYYILNASNKSYPKRIETLKRKFGDAFEGYIEKILTEMFSGRPDIRVIKSPIAHVSENGREVNVELCDFAIVRDHEVILIEAKAVALSDEAFDIQDPHSYKQVLLGKYGRMSKKHASGAGQLVAAVRGLSEQRIFCDAIQHKKALYIYPVLLSYDDILPIFGHIDLLSKKFTQALEPDHIFPRNGHMQKRKNISTQLIMMSIAELENLHGAIQKFDLFHFFSDYTSTFTMKPDSISSYIDKQSDTGRYSFYYNYPMIDHMIETLGRAGRLFFGDNWGQKQDQQNN